MPYALLPLLFLEIRSSMNESNPTTSNIDFATFAMSIASAAMMGLGLAPNPQTGKNEVDLGFAKQNIDLLELMKDKTKNNLTEQEQKLLDQLLFESRSKYVEITSKK